MATGKTESDQRKRHVKLAKEAGLGPLIKKYEKKTQDFRQDGPWSSYDKDKAVSDQVIKGYFSGNLRSKKRIADEQDNDTDEQNAVNNFYRDTPEFTRKIRQLQDTAKPQRIQVTPGKWVTASNLKGK